MSLCLSHKATLETIDQLCVDYDLPVRQWQASLATRLENELNSQTEPMQVNSLPHLQVSTYMHCQNVQSLDVFIWSSYLIACD